MRFSAWREIARYAVTSPSPYNTQPYRLRLVSSTEAEIVFLPRRGLPAADPQGRVTWLTAGILAEICSIAAHGLGYELQREWRLNPFYANGDVTTPQAVCGLKLVPSAGAVPDIDAQLILDRHTSRLPYDGRPIPAALVTEMQAEATRRGHSFESSDDKEAIGRVIELSRQAMLENMEAAPIRGELAHWLRFGEREESITHDGLSARCLGFSDRLLHSLFAYAGFWTLPGPRQILGRIYMRSMAGVGTIGWLRGPYVTVGDWIAAGETMIRLWLIVTRYGYYWHPYGSVITSEEARTSMIEYFGVKDEQGGHDTVWLLLRIGSSPKPPVSHRLPLEEIILCA